MLGPPRGGEAQSGRAGAAACRSRPPDVPRLAGREETGDGALDPRSRIWAAIRLGERRGRDLNPRRTQRPETVFETAAFDRSATPPRNTGYFAPSRFWLVAGSA